MTTNMLALNSPSVTVAGITVVQGNVPAEKGYSNARHLLGLLGRQEVPLKRGALRPLNAERTTQVKWLEQRYAAPQITDMVELPFLHEVSEPDSIHYLEEPMPLFHLLPKFKQEFFR